MRFYTELQEQMKKIVEDNNLDEDSILIKTTSLTPERGYRDNLEEGFPAIKWERSIS